MTHERTAGAGSAASPERLWAALLDGRRWSRWNPAVEWMVLEGPLQPGSTVTVKPKGGRQTALRIEEADAPRRLGLVVTMGPLATLRVRWDIAPETGGATIVQTVAVSGPLGGLLERAVGSRIAGDMEPALERLAVHATE